MPIRFRCAHCDKLLGIARRKAGSIVNCPQCGQPLIVPTPEDEVPDAEESTKQTELPTDRGPAKLFEDGDLDKLLGNAPAAPKPRAAGHSSRAIVPQPRPAANAPVPTMPAPMPAPVPVPLPVSVPTAGGITIGKVVVIILVVFVLVTAAFVGGLFAGKGQ